MKITRASKYIQQPIKMHVLYMSEHQFWPDSADKDQNLDTVMFLVTTLKMILTDKKKWDFHISPQNLLC